MSRTRRLALESGMGEAGIRVNSFCSVHSDGMKTKILEAEPSLSGVLEEG